jgi:sialidase-1
MRWADQDYGRAIGIAITHGGRKFVCWVGGEDNPKAYFLLFCCGVGTDDWGEPVLAIDPHAEDLTCDRYTIVGTLWVDPQNRL